MPRGVRTSEQQPTLPSYPSSAKHPHPVFLSKDERDQLFEPPVPNEIVGSQSEYPPSLRQEDTRLSRAASCQHHDNSREGSGDREASLPLSSGGIIPSRELSRPQRALSLALPPIRRWVLEANHPRRPWRHRPGIRFHDETLSSLFEVISSHSHPRKCSSWNVTARVPDEAWTFCLPTNDEEYFEDIKQFVLNEAKICRSRKNSEGRLDLFLSPSEETDER